MPLFLQYTIKVSCIFWHISADQEPLLAGGENNHWRHIKKKKNLNLFHSLFYIETIKHSQY